MHAPLFHPQPEARHLYVHVPFCPKICPYCSFFKTELDAKLRESYVLALENEIQRCASRVGCQPETIFFGGGTPTALTASQLSRIGASLHHHFDLYSLKEWTVEMNPATVSTEKASALLDMGVTRISMGVQSWDPQLLHALGRVHSAEEAERSFEILREAGVSNINLDLIFAVPGQSRQTWLDSLEKTIRLRPDHISAYSLTYEEDTDFLRRLQKGELRQDHDLDADLFLLTMSTLESAGYEQYEISNYARPGRECLHNLAYWEGAPYLGLGPSAVSTLGASRRTNVPDTHLYVEALLAGRNPPCEIEHLESDGLLREQLAFALRTNRGISAEAGEPWREMLLEYEASGWLERTDEARWRLTRQGRMLADSLVEIFF